MDTVEILAVKFGRPLISLDEALDMLGRRPKRAAKSAREARSRGQFPCATRKIGRARLVHIADLAAVIDGSAVPRRDGANPPATRRAGRPRKTASAAPQKGGEK
jgi:hypothetical protein